ncbi:hypothetical protein SCB49_00365 [unidentified eubacterium SCB49]|nr:hypothetical protein SCB49_00365 [unidentified eubacterium SCB49]
MTEENENIIEVVKQKFIWKWKFTAVLIANAVYIYLMYLLMNHFA